MRILHDTISALDMSTSFITSPQDYSHLYIGSIQIVWTGTPAGTFQPQESDDGVTWFDLDTSQAAGGAAGTKLYKFNVVDTTMIRLKYTASSSTGTATVIFVGKGN